LLLCNNTHLGHIATIGTNELAGSVASICLAKTDFSIRPYRDCTIYIHRDYHAKGEIGIGSQNEKNFMILHEFGLFPVLFMFMSLCFFFHFLL
jgi:hypothetical protein